MIKKRLDSLLSLCTLPVLGMVLTVNYFLLTYYLFHDRFFQIAEIPLNEAGDFLAGIFGPIAFLWLVIGYLMQNKELKNSVEQTKEAQRLASNQLEFQKSIRDKDEKIKIIESQPIFNIERQVFNYDGWLKSEEPIIKLRVEKNDAFNVFFTRKEGLIKTLTHNESHIKVGQDVMTFYLNDVEYEEILSSIKECGENSFHERSFLEMYINYTDKMGAKRKVKANLNARCDQGERKVYIEYKHFEWE
jgi:hypothetical protein